FPNALSTAYLIGTPPSGQKTIKVQGGHVRGVVNPPLFDVLDEFMKQYSGERDRPAGWTRAHASAVLPAHFTTEQPAMESRAAAR
ncbi:MAG: hypothetical protein ACLGPL_10895, partial [Acidobacteriota bacterium]